MILPCYMVIITNIIKDADPYSTTSTPLKINMEHNHGSLVQIFFISKRVICRFHVNLPGCIMADVLFRDSPRFSYG